MTSQDILTSVESGDNQKNYTIKPGDSLSKIVNKINQGKKPENRVTVEDLKKWNNITDINRIQANTSLRLTPPVDSSPVAESYRRVDGIRRLEAASIQSVNPDELLQGLGDIIMPALPDIAFEAKKTTPSFSTPEEIAGMNPKILEKEFGKILASIINEKGFSFNNLDQTTFRSLQAVYQNGKIPTSSPAGIMFAHGLANAIIQSGELGSNKTIITNDFVLQEEFKIAIRESKSPNDLRTRLTEIQADGWGRLRRWRREENAREANLLANTGITPENKRIIEGAGYQIAQEKDNVMIVGEKSKNINIHHVLSVNNPVNDVRIEGGYLVISSLRGNNPLKLKIQGNGDNIQLEKGAGKEVTSLSSKTDNLYNAVGTLNPSTSGLVYRRLGVQVSNDIDGKELFQNFLTDPRFSTVRDAIAKDILVKARVESGGFLGMGKKMTQPDLANIGIGDIVLTGVGSNPKIENGVEFEVSGKKYMIGNSRDRTEGVILLSKEQATKTYEPARFSEA